MSDKETKTAKAGDENPKNIALDELIDLFTDDHSDKMDDLSVSHDEVNLQNTQIQDDLDLSFLGMEFAVEPNNASQSEQPENPEPENLEVAAETTNANETSDIGHDRMSDTCDISAASSSSPPKAEAFIVSEEMQQYSSPLSDREFAGIMAEINADFTDKPMAYTVSDSSDYSDGSEEPIDASAYDNDFEQADNISDTEQNVSPPAAEEENIPAVEANTAVENNFSDIYAAETAEQNNVFATSTEVTEEETPPFFFDEDKTAYDDNMNNVVEDNDIVEGNASNENDAFNELYDVPSPVSMTRSQNPLTEELTNFPIDSEVSDDEISNNEVSLAGSEPLDEKIDTIFEELNLDIDTRNIDNTYVSIKEEETAPSNAEPEVDLTSPLFVETEEDLHTALDEESDLTNFEFDLYDIQEEKQPLPFQDSSELTVDETDSSSIDIDLSDLHIDIDTASPEPETEPHQVPLSSYDSDITDNAENILFMEDDVQQPSDNASLDDTVSYDSGEFAEAFSTVSHQPELNQTYSAPLVSVPDDDFDNSTELAPPFNSDSDSNEIDFEDALDGFGKEMDNLLSNQDYSTEDEAETVEMHNQGKPNSGRNNVLPPDVETYQFDDTPVEKTEPFDIPTVHYEEEEKPYSDPFEQEFEDVFNAGTSMLDDSSDESEDEFFKSAIDKKNRHTGYESVPPLPGSAEAQSSNWNTAPIEDNYYPDRSDDWDEHHGSKVYYDDMDDSSSPIKKIGTLAGLCAAALLLLGGGYYYFTGSSAPENTVTIHADNTPVRVSPNSQSVPEDTTESASSTTKPHSTPQQSELVDSSETPQNLNAASTPSNTSSNNVEAALNAGSNNSVPTNVTIAVVVKPDGTFATEPVGGPQVTQSPSSSTPPVTIPEVEQSPSINGQNISSNEAAATLRDRFVINPAVLASAIQFPNTAPVGAPVTEPFQQQQTNNQTQPSAAPSEAGNFYVQISSQPNEDLAQAALNSARSRFASIIGGRQLEIQRADIPGKGIYYRVRIAAGSRESATNLCQTLQSAGGSCFISR